MRARAVRVTTAMLSTSLVLTLVGSCGDAEKEKPSAGSPSGSPAGVVAEPVVDEAGPDPVTDHTVEEPGERTGAIFPPDIVVTDDESLDEETVSAIAALEGVESVERVSLAQITVENEAFTVAAVDPATYRNFTPTGSAQLAEVWSRVAGGEMAISRKLKKVLQLDDEGYADLGQRRIHVGAIADQAVGIDAVVNTTWVESLGMTPGNALLVRTGIAAPQALREPIQQLVGEDRMQLVDAMTREGLDPDAQLTAVLVGSFADAVGVFNYTAIGGGRIAPDPAWVRSHIETRAVPILGTVTCNKFIFPQLEAALRDIQAQGLADEIHPEEYAGCYYPRFIAGSTKLSNHSFGTALDLNVPGNLRGTVGEMDRGVVAIFKKWGFGWGGDWNYTDPMHFEVVQIVRPEPVNARQ
jgi:hypothetical protein